MRATIVLLPGDGIGPEVTAEAVKVLRAISQSRGHALVFQDVVFGSAAIEKTGHPLPPETLEACR